MERSEKILSKKHNVEQCVVFYHLGKNEQKKNMYYYSLTYTLVIPGRIHKKIGVCKYVAK